MNSDVRSGVIIAASLVEQGLERLIRSRLYRFNSEDNNALFGAGGAFGNFAAKVRIAHALGIIGPETRRDLLSINDIRNVFAHSPMSKPMATKAMKQKVLSLRMFHFAYKHRDGANVWFEFTSPEQDFELNPAGVLIYAIGIYAVFIGSDRQKRKPPPKHPITFFGIPGNHLLS